MRQFGDLALPLSILLMLLLAAYLALYPAIFALVLFRLRARFGAGALWLAPAVWVATELGRSHLFTGFPWVLLGYSQVSVLPVAQLASVVGVYGLSFLVALVNSAGVLAVLRPPVGLSSRKWSIAAGGRDLPGSDAVSRWWPLAFALVLAALVAAGGAIRMRANGLTSEGEPIQVGIIQGNVAQEQKWDPARAEGILARYLDMSRTAARRGARFIVWPESSLPYFFEEDPVHGDAVRQLARETRSWVLFGSDQVVRDRPPRYYNSAFVLAPTGAVAAVYQKIHLVPFGEYVPLKNLLFFAGPLVESVSDFSPGERMPAMPVSGHQVNTAICYEVVYPHLARQAVAGGSELLTTITNDAWYGRSSAPWQHFEQASMRAIEQGRYLVRSANTGISGIVDPYGRVVARSKLFERTALVGEARFLTGLTIYGRIGDVFAYACAILVAGAILASRDRGSGIGDRGSGIRDQGSGIRDQGSGKGVSRQP
jgi:apolipoprotein N-acyltransferase